jgi:hypothetical protein
MTPHLGSTHTYILKPGGLSTVEFYPDVTLVVKEVYRYSKNWFGLCDTGASGIEQSLKGSEAGERRAISK